MKKYIHLWLILTKNSFLVSLTSWTSVGFLLLGKTLRFLLLFLFLYSLITKTKSFSGYSVEEILFFYLTYVIIDTLTQLFFREVYRFRPLIVEGNFDLVLVKPMNALFRSLAGGADVLDLFMMIPYGALLCFYMSKIPEYSLVSVVLYGMFLLNGLLIATAFYIIVLSLTIITSEIDHTVMIYRDVTRMGMVPVDIYKEPIRTIITFIVPIGIMMTVPVKVFLGRIQYPWLVCFLGIGIVFFFGSLRLWNFAVRQYSSASS